MRISQSSNLSVTAIGLGCMGMSEFYGATDTTMSEETLTHALELGVTLFDTADAYGFGHNEQLVGRVLGQSKYRDRITLATKCGLVRDINDPTQRGVNNDPRYILECCDRSLERLGTPIDLYYLHRIAHQGTQLDASMEAMATLLQAGKIKHVGISEANCDQIRKAHTALLSMTDGRQGLAAVQTEYSMMSRGAEADGVLDLCHELGILFIAYSPISRGLLSGQIQSTAGMGADDFRKDLPRFQGDNFTRNLDLVNALTEFAAARDMTMAQLSLTWLLTKAPHIVPIPGTRRIKYLDENMESLKKTLSVADMAALTQLLTQHPTQGLRYPEAAMKIYGLTD